MDKFVEFVMDEALRQTGLHFFLDSGEGREMPNPPPELETDVEDLSGWLMTSEQLEELKLTDRMELFEHDEIPFVFALWSVDENGKLAIKFEVQNDVEI